MSPRNLIRSNLFKWALMTCALFWVSVYKLSEQQARLPDFVYVNF
jgi:hypothetical protein